MLLKTTRVLIVLAVLFGSLVVTRRASGQRRVGDICRVHGMGEIQVQGLGLIVGLNGTGDGGNFTPLTRSLMRTMELLGNRAVSPDELKNAKNVALVMVTATISETGGVQGERIDCVVSSFGLAKSLLGGRLVMTPLVGPIPDQNGDPEVYAIAEGLLTIESLETPTTAKVQRGCRLEKNLQPVFTRDGVTIKLVLHNQFAGFRSAQEVVGALNLSKLRILNGDKDVAHAPNPKEVIVQIPYAYQQDSRELVPYVADVLGQELTATLNGKRVTINERAGTIVIDGDVTVFPCLIQYQGMAVDLTGGSSFRALDPADPKNPKLEALLSALNAVSASPEIAIQVIKELENIGNLNGELVVK